jgi:hypothetical protein
MATNMNVASPGTTIVLATSPVRLLVSQSELMAPATGIRKPKTGLVRPAASAVGSDEPGIDVLKRGLIICVFLMSHSDRVSNTVQDISIAMKSTTARTGSLIAGTVEAH